MLDQRPPKGLVHEYYNIYKEFCIPLFEKLEFVQESYVVEVYCSESDIVHQNK